MSNTLFGISFSPWSIKARWALDHHAIPYRYVEYIPLVGAPRLRLVLRRFRGPVSVPVLRTDREVLSESLDIARWADDQSSDQTLFPDKHRDDVMRWDRRSQALLGPGRTLALRAAMKNPEALRGDLPGPLGKLPGAATVARAVVGYIMGKYPVPGSDDELEAQMKTQLVALRDALGDSDYLLGTFSYADITMAVALQGVRPPGRDMVPISDASREAWIRPDLADEFAPLLAWRDRVYQRHHRRASRTR